MKSGQRQTPNLVLQATDDTKLVCWNTIQDSLATDTVDGRTAYRATDSIWTKTND